MFRIVLHATWLAIYVLYYLILFNNGFSECYAPRKKTVKARIMSNVSMTMYWLFQGLMPFEIIKDETDWETIAGVDEAEEFVFE